MPIVIGTLGIVTNKFKSELEKLGIGVGTETVQKAGLFGTARILRRVFGISLKRTHGKAFFCLHLLREVGRWQVAPIL